MSATDSLIGNRIANRYHVKEKLGAGGMGAVYWVTDRLTARDLALKRVHVDPTALSFSTSAVSESANMRMALANEFQLLASLRHPNIISVEDYGFDEQQAPYFTMALLENADNIDIASLTASTSQRVHLIGHVLQALDYIHRHGILHRDLKPTNILVKNGRAYVVDFGLALNTNRTNGSEMAGTLLYLAPELLMGESPSPQSDLFSLGVIAYELFSGIHPFYADSMQKIIDNIFYVAVDLEELDLETAMKAFIGRLLSKDPADRYHSAFEALNALSEATGYSFPLETTETRESFLQASQFVGRSEELKRLSSAVKALFQPESNVARAFLVGGESGVGKSRLMSEIRTQALTRGIRVLWGQAIAEGGLTYQLWRDIVRRLLLAVEVDNEEARALKRIVPDINTLIGREVEELPADDTMAVKRLTIAIESLLRRVCDKTPVLLLLDDLQWSQESLTLLGELLPLTRTLPLMIVGAYRNDERPTLPSDFPQMESMLLQRLDQAETRRLSESILGKEIPSEAFIAFLQRETEGNVFFMVEVLRVLAQDAGTLREVPKMSLPKQVFSGGIQRVLETRLNRVPARAYSLLELSAVNGRAIVPKLLYALDSNIDVENWLTVCVNIAILDKDDMGYRFAHDKLRETLLMRLTPEQRAPHHRRVAEAIELVYQENLSDYTNLLAYHWRLAGDKSRESSYLLEAIRQALSVADYPEALRLCHRADEIEAFRYFQNPDLAQADFLQEKARVAYQRGEYNQVLADGEMALELYKRLNHPRGVANAVGILGELAMRQSHVERAIAFTTQNLAYYTEQNDLRQIGYAHMTLGVIYIQQNIFDQAYEHFQKSYDYLLQTTDALSHARAMNNLAVYYDLRGEIDHATQLHEQSLAIRRRLNDRVGVAYSLSNIGFLLMDSGKYNQVLPYMQEAELLLRQTPDKNGLASVLSGLGELYFHLQRYEESERYQKESVAIRREIKVVQGVTKSLQLLANLYLIRENWQEMRQALHECLSIAIERDVLAWKKESLTVMARYYENTELAYALALYHALENAEAVARLRGDLSEEAFTALLAKAPAQDVNSWAVYVHQQTEL